MKLVTAVVGAGPAGLLFCVVGRILAEQRGVPWAVRLYDKRESYARSHRLRMAPEPYRAIQRELADARFDELIAFLEQQRFTPTVNALEAQLQELLSRLGVTKEVFEVTSDADLRALRTRAGADGEVFTVVAADSVHSTVRGLVAGDVRPAVFTHQQVARLRVTGPALPDALGALQQYKLSKALGSILDYRKNENGFGEVDLFLVPGEHRAVADLGATPKAPVPLDPRKLSRVRAPLFRRIVEHLGHGFGSGACEVLLQSTFRLEHAVMPRRTFAADDVTTFVVGDAAVSLPFFRGMAALARCARALALTHVDLAARLAAAGIAPRQLVERAAGAYEAAVDDIVKHELRVVRARARLISGLREFVRVSALVPFPLQSWFLSVDAAAPRTSLRPTPGAALNALVAVVALAVAFLQPWWPALVVEVIGGAAYRAATTFEPSAGLARRIWQAHGALLLAVGGALATRSVIAAEALHAEDVRLALWWFVLAVPFVAGMYIFEGLGRRWLTTGALDS